MLRSGKTRRNDICERSRITVAARENFVSAAVFRRRLKTAP
jgi:hypothetical protein